MNHLDFLAYHHTHGWTDWLAHVTVSAAVHALIYGFVFRLMHHLTLGQAAVLVAVVLACLFMWTRARVRRGTVIETSRAAEGPTISDYALHKTHAAAMGKY